MIEIKGLKKIFYTKAQEFIALNDINLTFYDGEFIAVLGESGSGKSTLLNMLSGIDYYTEGEIIIDGVSTKKFDDSSWRKFRNKNIGFVFQRYNLVEHLTAKENVMLPLMFSGVRKQVYESKSKKILAEVGLEEHINTTSSRLSGGEKQRVAISRSILAKPHILLCDEPTGALDSASATSILTMIKDYSEQKRIVLLVTHDEKLANDYADRIIRIKDGSIISDEYNEKMEKSEPDEETKQMQKLSKNKKFASGYKNVNRSFIKFLANANFKQNKASNLKIITSFVIGLAILFIINLILNNAVIHNKLMFERNNDYQKYFVTNYEDNSLEQLKLNSDISEVGLENRYLVENSYLSYQDNVFESDYIESVNNVHNIELKTMTKDPNNFYLSDQLLYEDSNSNKITNGVFVTSELIYNHYLNTSFEKDYYKNYKKELKTFFEDYPLDSFLNQSLYICGDNTDDNENCFETKIVGILDSNYNGINYAGTIFISPDGFTNYLNYLQADLKYTSIDNLYESDAYFYFKDFKNGNHDISQLEDQYNIQITNSKLNEFQQGMLLENFANYLILFIIFAIFIIFGTVVMNIVLFNISSRTKDIGVYTSIGVSRVSIRRIFVRETMKVLTILIIILIAVYTLIVVGFSSLYTRIISFNSNLIKELGRINTISYEVDIFLYVILATILLYLLSVYIPAYRISRKKAIETLTW